MHHHILHVCHSVFFYASILQTCFQTNSQSEKYLSVIGKYLNQGRLIHSLIVDMTGYKKRTRVCKRFCKTICEKIFYQ